MGKKATIELNLDYFLIKFILYIVYTNIGNCRKDSITEEGKELARAGIGTHQGGSASSSHLDSNLGDLTHTQKCAYLPVEY